MGCDEKYGLDEEMVVMRRIVIFWSEDWLAKFEVGVMLSEKS